jgi:hypothetical protein
VTVSTTSGTGSGTAAFTYAANFSGASRSALISVAGVQLNVLQNSTTSTTVAPPSNLRIVK